VQYSVAPAEDSGLPRASVDLIAVAPALHWFDLERFYAEARRVARRGALLAAWCYGMFRVAHAEVDTAAQRFYSDTLSAYWPHERRHVDAGYRTIEFPRRELSVPAFQMRARWSLEQLVGMLQSWSAVGQYRKARGEDPLPELEQTLRSVWPDDARELDIEWPLTVRAARL
jgi:hypothetical protein